MIAKVPKPHVSPRVLLLLGQPDGQITQFHNQPAHWDLSVPCSAPAMPGPVW